MYLKSDLGQDPFATTIDPPASTALPTTTFAEGKEMIKDVQKTGLAMMLIVGGVILGGIWLITK